MKYTKLSFIMKYESVKEKKSWKKGMIKKRVKIGLIFWHFNNEDEKLCVYFNCLVTCKTCSAHWIMRIRCSINIVERERVQFFLMSFRKLSFDYKMAPVQCVTTMTNVGRTVNLWSFSAVQKLFTWWSFIHTHARTLILTTHTHGKYHTCQPPPNG